jgi:hypothetical protein
MQRASIEGLDQHPVAHVTFGDALAAPRGRARNCRQRPNGKFAIRRTDEAEFARGGAFADIHEVSASQAQSEAHTGPITLSDCQRFRLVGDRPA